MIHLIVHCSQLIVTPCDNEPSTQVEMHDVMHAARHRIASDIGVAYRDALIAELCALSHQRRHANVDDEQILAHEAAATVVQSQPILACNVGIIWLSPLPPLPRMDTRLSAVRADHCCCM